MKKLVISSLLFTLTLSISTFYLSQIKSKKIAYIPVVTKSNNNELIKLNTGGHISRVKENSDAEEDFNVNSIVHISRFSIDNCSKNVSYKDIYSIGDELQLDDNSTYVFSTNARLYSLNGTTAEFDNLDDMTCTISFKYSTSLVDFSQITFYAGYYYHNAETPLEIMNISYSQEKGYYYLTLKIKNSYKFYNNQKISVVYKTNQYIEGKFIYSEAIYDFDTEPYVYKYYLYNDGQYIKKIPIKIVESIGSFTIIECEELLKDNYVFWTE